MDIIMTHKILPHGQRVPTVEEAKNNKKALAKKKEAELIDDIGLGIDKRREDKETLSQTPDLTKIEIAQIREDIRARTAAIFNEIDLLTELDEVQAYIITY